MIRTDNNTTICALSTARGRGALAVVRVSGSRAIEIADKIFVSVRGTKLRDIATHTAHFGKIMDGRGEVIDEVVCTVFRSPKSFTGEDMAEFSCHGSEYISGMIVRRLIDEGCVMAGPGEFTQRAFLAGRMDLSQAEAVADLIAAETKGAHRLAMSQMKGEFSKELSELRDSLLHFVSLIELELDFGEEDVEFADRTELNDLLDTVDDKVTKLMLSFARGEAIKNGIPVAIIGETNVGKSTLLNMLLREERAIVSDIHGTTRDTIEETLDIDGVLFRLVDTAGLRETEDVVESKGIERTVSKAMSAKTVVLVIDSTKNYEDICVFIDSVREYTDGRGVVVLFNKIDKIECGKLSLLEKIELPHSSRRLFVSANDSKYRDDVLRSVSIASGVGEEFDDGGVVVSNARHYEALREARESLLRVKEGMFIGLSGDLLSQDIRDTISALAKITGEEITPDEVLGNIFKNFCIGK